MNSLLKETGNAGKTCAENTKRIARIAGIWYLILGIGAGYSWMFISSIYVDGSATLTAENIIQSEFRYIIAIIFSITGQIGFTLLGLTLHQLLKQVNENISKIMVTLVLVSIPVMFVNIIIETGALVVLKANYLSAFSMEQIQSIAMAFVNMHITGVHTVEIFWGLWLFPLGYLVYKSIFFPENNCLFTYTFRSMLLYRKHIISNKSNIFHKDSKCFKYP
jgi:hypothetical protein